MHQVAQGPCLGQTALVADVPGDVSVALFSAVCFSQDIPKGAVPAGLLRLGDGNTVSPPYALVVDKSKKLIHVIDSSSGIPTVIESYPSDLGKNGGPKMAESDSKTPEGIYFLQRVLQGPGLDPHMYGVRAYVTDYPNFFDLRDGKTGHGIWLHAIDEKVGLDRGSKGCVVVRNDTILKLASRVTLRETPLMIFDKVQWVSIEEDKKDADGILDIVSKWKQLAWETKDVDTYINFCDKDFKALGKMNLTKWKAFKTDLAQRYKDIKVSLSMPVIYSHKNTLVVRFYQDYQSSEHADFGEKTLYFLKRDDGYKILGENWQEQTNPETWHLSLLAGGNNLCCQVPSDQVHN